MKERVAVAMSGGVDSSVVAALLVEEGYDVVGLTIKTYRYEDVGGNSGNEKSCCSLDGIQDARSVASALGIPHYVLDFSEPFGARVIDDFVAEYLRGRTPNPCVICNRTIKWEELIRKADALGATHVATGHYARLRRDPATGRYIISRGADEAKDQSYALWALTQESLARTIFPLGGMTKGDVRARAASFGLPVAAKGESFEICFIPDDNYERFLKERDPGLARRVEGGEIVLDGNVVGTHRGYPFYTIGQRRGLGVASDRPLYVTAIDPGSNRISIGPREALFHRSLIARGVNMVKYPGCTPPRTVHARIRYRDSGGEALAADAGGGLLRVTFREGRRAITPGQSVVLYEGDDVVGGGIIDAVVDARE
ncbi:MAG TPA: tRNA 2-thiouridine(34) synthase MnmA [Bacteroidota bacterium]|nr:tRNA 2-thiouridine(34) synthase MnmA [Bacteroidota bacterium]